MKDSTKKSGRKPLKDKTLSGLQDKVISHEKGINGSSRKRFKEVFKIVLSTKLQYIKTEEKLISAKTQLRMGVGNAITDVVNATKGNIIMASSLFGNTPDVAMQNYYTGANLTKAKEILDGRVLS